MKLKFLLAFVMLTISSLSFAGAECYIGEINYFPYGFTPAGYLEANGAPLLINGNQALYTLIGTVYGGSNNNFNLPNIPAIKPNNVDTNSNYGLIKAYICVQGYYPNRP